MMATATTTDERPHNLSAQSIQDALQDLVKSSGIHVPDGEGPSTNRFSDLQQACEKLRELPFHSEEGRHLVIVELTKLHGNYVVKIVCKGLCSLSKVYSSDTKTFENEATDLVKLCCLQYSMQSSEDGHQVASPANVIEWTVELCDELLTPSNDSYSHGDEDTSSINGPFLIRYLAKLTSVYKSITSGRMKTFGESGQSGLERKVVHPFKSIFEALKHRIKSKSFEELIEQTAAIVRTEENLDFINFSSIGAPKTAILLEHWISLLKFPFVTNWFAIKTAKHDFLVHDGGYAQSLPFSNQITYCESLIVQIVGAFSILTSSNEQYQLSCDDKAKLQVFFDNSEVLLRHTISCLQLMQSDIETSLVKEIFLLLQIKLNRDLLPRITDLDRTVCQPLLDACQKIILSSDHLHLQLQAMMEAANAEQVLQMKNMNHISTRRPHQTACFNAVTQALLTLPDKQQVLKILQILSKHKFSDDTYYFMLSELFLLVEAIIQETKESVSNDMEKLISFLLQLPPDFFSTLRIWRPLFERLLVFLPHSCYDPEVVNLIRIYVHLHVRNTLRSSGQNDGAIVQTFCSKVQFFLFELPIKQDSQSEEVKLKALQLALELFEEIPNPDEYQFVLNVIQSVASDLEASGIKTFILSLLKTARVHITKIQYPEIWQLISLIDQSHSIQRKSEVYLSYLEVLQKTRGDVVMPTVHICRDFLRFSDCVNSDNTKRFFALAAEGRIDTCQFVLECLFFKQLINFGDRVNEYIVFLLTIVERTLSSDRTSCQLFFKTIHDYLQLPLLAYGVDTFEIIVALIAGSIAMGTFDKDLNEVVLRVLFVAVQSRKLDNRAVIVITYFYLSQTLRQVSVKKGRRYMESFAEGVRLIMRLPLKLQQTKWIIQKVIAILDQEITEEQDVWNVMCHLFKMGDESCIASIDPSDIESHFKKVLKPSVVRNTTQILLLFRQKESMLSGGDKQETPLSAIFSLSDLLVERMPSTFANKTSAKLYKFIVKRVEKKLPISTFILPVAEVIIKETVSEDELKTEIKEIEETFLHVQPELVHMIAECLRQYYLGLDVSEKNIKLFILQILECLRNWKLNLEDTHNMIVSSLNIPKQLVLAFQTASNDSGAVKDMARVFDVATKVDPVIFNGQFLLQFPKEKHERLIELIQHDFFMVLTKTSVVVSDVCTVLEIYRHLKPDDLLTVLTLSGNFDAKIGNSNAFWLNKYSRNAVLTPGNLVYLVLIHLRRIRIPKSDVGEKALAICSQLFINHSLNRQVPCHCLMETTFEEYIDSFFLVINQLSSLAEIEHWLTFLPHHAVQTKKVIVAACSWKESSESREELRCMIDCVSKTLLKLLAPTTSEMFTFCYAAFTREMEVMELILSKAEDEEIANNLLNLISTSRDLTEACLGVVSSWSKKESLVFIEKMKQLYECSVDSEIATPLQILPFAAKAFPNSTVRVIEFFQTATEMGGGPEDPLSLGQISVWYKQMTDAGYPPQVIQSWCTSLVHSQNLCSSDVDAVTNINPEMIKAFNKDSDEVGRCLFSKDAPKTWESEDETQQEHRINSESFKCCLLFARLLNELASIAGCLKENSKAVEKIRQCTRALCSGFSDNERSSGNLYKVRYCLWKELFVLLFGKENRVEEEQPKMQVIMAHQDHKPLAKSLIILFRRLARSFASRPTLLGIVRGIVDTIQKRVVEHSKVQYQEVQGVILETILSLESNQDAMHTLQATGYNQCTSPKENLWYSSSIEMSAYVTLIASDESLQLERSLRQLCIEWRDVLLENRISEIPLDEGELKTTELFKPSDSLETIESQLLSVKQATKSLPQDNWSSYRRRQLIRNERRLRKSIDEQKKQAKEMTGSKLTKMAIVWENRLLESVKTCSEKIPGCYAPNGFHSEKPVICGIAVDNRILTLYKEDQGGTRTEVENVEVKLYPAGMVVFGAYRSIHPYDTDQLWAAFYKMLLDKRLVPKIFITNVSPAFDWIIQCKQFVTPESTPPRHTTFESCCNLIPSSEDSYDYNPEILFHLHRTTLESPHGKELIILTPAKAQRLEITNLKPPNRGKLIHENIGKVVLHLREDGRLQEMHPKSHDKILDRLKFAIRHAVEIAVDGGKPTQESISKSIDMKRLLFGCQDTHQYSKDDYSAVVLDAVNTVTGDLRDSRKTFDGCQHVEFLQQMK